MKTMVVGKEQSIGEDSWKGLARAGGEWQNGRDPTMGDRQLQLQEWHGVNNRFQEEIKRISGVEDKETNCPSGPDG